MQLHIQFGADRSSVALNENILSVRLANRPLGPERDERWGFPQSFGDDESIFKKLEGDSIVFGAASVETQGECLDSLTKQVYEELFKSTHGLSIYRIWHFIPSINEVPEGGLENYQAFCKGRSLAFQQAYHLDLDKFMPSASAVGTTESQLTLVYIAGRHPCSHFENPQQTPAYKYPKDYGPRAPSFARATAIHTPKGIELFISGTASIRGSESVGATIDEQLGLTIENLKIIEAEFKRLHPEAPSYRSRKVRVYLRHVEDLAFTQAKLGADYLRPEDSVVYVQADICRKELKVEIEVTLAPF